VKKLTSAARDFAVCPPRKRCTRTASAVKSGSCFGLVAKLREHISRKQHSAAPCAVSVFSASPTARLAQSAELEARVVAGLSRAVGTFAGPSRAREAFLVERVEAAGRGPKAGRSCALLATQGATPFLS
jgi:hypothetical protein